MVGSKYCLQDPILSSFLILKLKCYTNTTLNTNNFSVQKEEPKVLGTRMIDLTLKLKKYLGSNL